MNLTEFRQRTAHLSGDIEIFFKDLNFAEEYSSFEEEHFEIKDGKMLIDAPFQTEIEE